MSTPRPTARPTGAAPRIHAAGKARQLATRADSIDFRDSMYVATLVEVPPRRELAGYRQAGVPVLDQGTEGACTGFGLATVAHYLLRTRRVDANADNVSPYMLYDMARRYDEWAGADYEGSSCRGAIKGWYKHGVCAAPLWARADGKAGVLGDAVVRDAAARPLGAYLRVNHKSLVDMHAAISEAGVLYASASVHKGWQQVAGDGVIVADTTIIGGHAFAIVAYDEHGFWVQNSWGAAWGMQGFGRIAYADWLRNGSDVWVARLGAPVLLPAGPGEPAVAGVGAVRAKPYLYSEIRPHVIALKNDGQLNEHGEIATSAAMLRQILREDFPRISAGWRKKRLVLYAHGGLTGQDEALQRIAEYRSTMLKAECYPLAFIWRTDYWTTLANILSDALRRRRPEGMLDASQDFMLDRLDDLLEPIGRIFTGKAVWSEIKENALMATSSASGGARIAADEIARLVGADADVEIHLVSHSAGAVLQAALLQYLCTKGRFKAGPLAKTRAKGLGLDVASCTLWAPACSMELFRHTYLPALQDQGLKKLALFTLTDRAEQDDNCAGIYNKSLLYLVSNAFERIYRKPLERPDGEPLLGMEKFIRRDAALEQLFASGAADWVRSPNTAPPGQENAAQAVRHGDFDDDSATLRATIARITGSTLDAAPAALAKPTQSECARLRRQIEQATKPAR
ncbi:C1 family peptidase [Janthinobacterium fluminis]|uniref:C1 family peptidase n=1 Tax=Janthinobacterium fluminis TaxID=2987524 RepID=A0ABT5K4K0_9BURK|nr:C1 family peptidase [Janthinobacterium fluminis]MDC8759924.1 C1 family peptidase [Janthinobacterium fluminis]